MASGWEIYLKVYAVLALAYIWYRFGLLFLMDLRGRSQKAATAYEGQLLSVVVPFYNERPEILEETIESLLKADGQKEIIVVDDGSTDLAGTEMVQEKYAERVQILRYSRNRGKRAAQWLGARHASGEVIIMVDSDTVVLPSALVRLVEPLLANEKVGATTGQVKILNEDQNVLTRMTAAYYWSAFNIGRKSLTRFGLVTCCSGALSAYRADLFKKILKAYVTQRFMGKFCTYGDDRHLTNLVLKEGYRTQYVEDALCFTTTPTTYRQFFRQQLRWRKSFIRESLISLKFAHKHGPLLPIEVLFNLVPPFLSIALRIAVLATMIVHPVTIPAFLIGIVTITVIRNFFLFFENKRLGFYAIPFAFLMEFGLYWLYPIALFTLSDHGWGTR